VHFVGLFLSSLLKMHGPKNKNVFTFLLGAVTLLIIFFPDVFNLFFRVGRTTSHTT